MRRGLEGMDADDHAERGGGFPEDLERAVVEIEAGKLRRDLDSPQAEPRGALELARRGRWVLQRHGRERDEP